MTNNDKYLAKCRQLIEDTLSWGDSAGWTNDDFEDLSDKIAEKTAVRLSISTLKRIWGKVRYESSPTASTLNALARFSGYESWRDFQHKHPADEENKATGEAVAVEISTEPQTPAVVPGIRRARYVPFAVFGVAGLIVLGLISFFSTHKTDKPPTPPVVKFESRKTTDELPNSVIFDYDASAFHSDNVVIQQNWDTTRRQNVPPDGKQVASIYYYPGYFKAKLLVDGDIKKQTSVFIKTKGWKGIIEKKPVPIYLNAGDIKQKDAMGISSATLREKTGSPVFSDTWVDFTNVRNFDGVDSANFTFETTVHNTSTVEESLCRKIKITLLGTNTAIIVPLSDKGCIADIGVLTGYQWFSGKDTDLSAFGGDMGKFQHVAFTLEKQRLKIYLNNVMILDAKQPITIGDVIGIRYEFEGTGEVKDVKLSSGGKVAYEEKF